MESQRKGRRLLAILALTTAAMLLLIAIGAAAVVIQKASADARDARDAALVNSASVTLEGIQPDANHILLLSFEFRDEHGRYTVWWSLRHWRLTRNGGQ